MVNAARELAVLLASWNIPIGQSAVNARLTVSSGEGAAFWREQAEAVNLAQELDAQLAAMAAAGDDVSMYERYLVEWYEGVFAYRTNWTIGQQAPAVPVSTDAMSMLRGLGLLISKSGTKGAGSPSRKVSLLGCLDDAIGLLETDLEGWDADEKAYIYEIIAAARKALEQDGIVGDRDVQSLINELMGILTGIAIDLREAEGQDSTRWSRVMDVVGKTSTVLRGILHDAEALTSLATTVAAIAAASSGQN